VPVAPDRYAFALTFHSLPLLPGHYRLRAHGMDPEGMRLFDHHEIPFVVAGTTRELGFCRLPHAWSAPGDAKPPGRAGGP
jgi:lipopolysaccharide transport system ATP-binding protein